MSNNPQSRKWQLTINNPDKYGMPREVLIEKTMLFNPKYFCMVDEIGDKGKTPHTHIYICSNSPMRFSTIQRRYNNVAHIEIALGSSKQNRDYIAKSGKWEGTLKAETQVENSFYEWGDIPKDEDTAERNAEVIEDLKTGKKVGQIIEERPELSLRVSALEKLSALVDSGQHEDEIRDVKVYYLYGETATGKTTYVYDKHGAKNICRITDYPDIGGLKFDQYDGQEVLVFDEFHGQVPITSMLTWLDMFPVYLPARYTNKLARFTIVYIISNLNLYDLYRNVQREKPEVWRAFKRRITEVIQFPIQEEKNHVNKQDECWSECGEEIPF